MGTLRTLKDELIGHAVMIEYLFYMVKFVVEGYLWDIARLAGFAYCCTPGADPDGSIGNQRLHWLILRGTVWTGNVWTKVQWRFGDSAWSGIKALWHWYWGTVELTREMARIERQLRPLMAEYGAPGQSCAEFVEGIPDLLKLADVGEAIKEPREPRNDLAA